ncbi:hypothetical protein RHGRI_006524 [Rhododendron griersonianum]|uniref:Uncharacterized protein n=1 Tax=Rhododendron griersonianum TaxID=479676 RepID=A0AAV6KTZ6_9ERIC|nr:hypothetical protein RHGRI_006524 [Rhododendron griersonianum]
MCVSVAQLLYSNSGKGVLALGSNGTMMGWEWGPNLRNPSGKRLLNSVRLFLKVTTSVLPFRVRAKTNDVTGVNLEEAVPCMALSKDDFYIISACGGKVSLYETRRLGKVKLELKGHEKRITGLVFSTNLKICVSSAADAQWVPQDVLPAPISFAVYSCDSQLVYTSFCDGNIGVFDADSLTLACRIAPSIYLYPAMLSG